MSIPHPTARRIGRPRRLRLLLPAAVFLPALLLALTPAPGAADHHDDARSASPSSLVLTLSAASTHPGMALPTAQPTPTPTTPAATATALISPVPVLPPPAQAPPSSAAPSSPGSSPTPSPFTAGGAGTSSGSGGGGAGAFDVGGRVREAINGWMVDLVTSALNPTLALLGRTVLATPDLTHEGRVEELWTGSRIAANAVFGFFVVAGGALVMTSGSMQARYAVKDVIPRLLVGVVAANVSLEVIGQAIEFANAFTEAIVGTGLDPAVTGRRLSQILIGGLNGGSPFIAVLGAVAAVLAVIVVFGYVIRVTVTILLIAAAPVFLICYAHPSTEGAARFWVRAIGGCLLIQTGQGLTLLTALRVFFAPTGSAVFGLPTDTTGLINILVATALMWILARIPVWVSKAVFTSPRSKTVSLVRSIIVLRGLRAVGVMR